MSELVIGLGEVGAAIYQLLKDRNFVVAGYDPNVEGFTSFPLDQNYEVIHICFGWSENFEELVRNYRTLGKNVVVHSTVIPGTCKELGVTYSPIRGIHNNMYEHLISFQKYYAGPIEDNVFEKRFPNCLRVEDVTKLERTKVVSTTYYGLLIAFRKYIDSNHPVYWHFSNELHQKFGNQPVLYNDGEKIGGHCILPNLDLLGDEILRDFIRDNGGQ
jgi:hypothetical protein